MAEPTNKLSDVTLDALFSDTGRMRRFLDAKSNRRHYGQIINTVPERAETIENVDDLFALQDCVTMMINTWGEKVDDLFDGVKDIQNRLNAYTSGGNTKKHANDRDAGEVKTGDKVKSEPEDITDEELDFLFSSAGLRTMKRCVRELPDPSTYQPPELYFPPPETQLLSKNTYVYNDKGERIGKKSDFRLINRAAKMTPLKSVECFAFWIDGSKFGTEDNVSFPHKGLINGYMCEDYAVRDNFYSDYYKYVQPENKADNCSSVSDNIRTDETMTSDRADEIPASVGEPDTDGRNNEGRSLEDVSDVGFDVSNHSSGNVEENVLDVNTGPQDLSMVNIVQENIFQPDRGIMSDIQEALGMTFDNVKEERTRPKINEERTRSKKTEVDELSPLRLAMLNPPKDVVVNVSGVEEKLWTSAVNEIYPEKRFKEGDVFKIPEAKPKMGTQSLILTDVFSSNSKVSTNLGLNPECGYFLSKEEKLRKQINAPKTSKEKKILLAFSIKTGDAAFKKFVEEDDSYDLERGSTDGNENKYNIPDPIGHCFSAREFAVEAKVPDAVKFENQYQVGNQYQNQSSLFGFLNDSVGMLHTPKLSFNTSSLPMPEGDLKFFMDGFSDESFDGLLNESLNESLTASMDAKAKQEFATWTGSLKPALVDAESRSSFDIKVYTDHILNILRHKKFLKYHELQEEVGEKEFARYFMACTMLANEGSIIINDQGITLQDVNSSPEEEGEESTSS